MKYTETIARVVRVIAVILLLTLLGAAALAEEPLALQEDIQCDTWVAPGEDIALALPTVEHATGYIVSVMTTDEDAAPAFRQRYDAAGDVAVPTDGLDAGLWRLRVTIEGEEGYRRLHWESAVMVGGPRPVEGEVALAVSETEIPVGGSALLWASAPGARQMALLLDDRELRDFEGDFFSTSLDNYEAPVRYDEVRVMAWYPDGSAVTSESVSFAVTGGAGEVGDIGAVIPDVVAPGNDLTVSFRKAANDADIPGNVYYTACVEDVTEEYWKLMRYKRTLSGYEYAPDYAQMGDAQTFTVPAAELVPGHTYRVELSASAVGWKQRVATKLVPCAAAAAEGVRLTVNGETGTVEVGTQQNYRIRLDIPGDFPEDRAVARVFNGREFVEFYENDANPGETHYFVLGGSQWVAGEYPIFAQMRAGRVPYGESWDDMTDVVTSNVVTLRVNGSGTTERATVAVPETVARGEMLNIEVMDPGADAERLWYCAYHIGGDWLDGYDYDVARGSGVMAYPTGALEPGLYGLQISCCGPDMAESYIYATFTVTEPEAPEAPEDFYFSTSAKTVTAHEFFYVSAYAPGAKYWDLLIQNDDNPDDAWAESWSGDGFGTQIELGGGEYTLTAYAYEDPWGEGDGWCVGKELHVTADTRGGLAPCAIVGDPAIAAGEEYAFTVDGLERADWWFEINLEQKSDGWATLWRYTMEDGEPRERFTIPAGLLEAGQSYRISLWADAKVYGGAGSWADFYVYDSVDDNIHLTVDGKGDKLDALVQQDVWLVADVPGARALMIYNGKEWRFHEDWHNNDEGHFEWGETVDAENSCFIVKAAYNQGANAEAFRQMEENEFNFSEVNWETDLEWSGISNVVRMNVTSVGIADPAVLEDVPEAVERGEPLRFTLASAGAADSDSRGTRFHAYILDQWYEWIDTEDWNGGVSEDGGLPMQIELPTARLAAGEYRLIVDSSALGYDWNGAEASFTVTEPEAGVVFRLMDVEPADEGDEEADWRAWREERVRFSVYAPGAAQIRVFRHQSDWPSDYVEDWYYEGDSAVDVCDFWECVVEFYAVAYDENDGEIARSELCRLRVEPRGWLEAPVVECTPLSGVGGTYQFHVAGLAQENADFWSVEVWDMDAKDDEGNWPTVAYFSSDGDDPNAVDDGEGGFNFLLATENLEANHRYRVKAHVWGRGWSDAWSENDFFLYGARNDQLTLTVNGDSERAKAWTHDEQSALVVIEAPGAKSVRLFNGNDWETRWDFDPEAGRLEFGCWLEAGERTLYAQACYYDDEAEWERVRNEVDSNEWAWTEISANSVRVTVHSHGPADLAVLDEEAYTVKRGELLRFSIEGGGAGDNRSTNFHAYIVDDRWRWDGSNDANVSVDQGGFPLEVCLATGYLQPDGDYRLIVDACAPGYDWVTSQFPLTVVSGEDFVFEVESDHLLRFTDFRFSAFARGAEWMEVFVHPVDQGENTEFDVRWDYPGDHVNGVGQLDLGEYEMYAVAHYDDGTERVSETVTVTVERRGPELLPARIVADAVAFAGEDYTFTVEDLHSNIENWYDITVHDKDFQWPEDYEGDEDLSLVWRGTREDYGDEASAFTVPGDCFVLGHSYNIDVWVDAEDYEGMGTRFDFFVTAGVDDNVTLTVNGGDSAELLASETAEIGISAPGASGVRFWNGDHWEERGEFDPDSGMATFGYGWNGDAEGFVYTLYAEARYGDGDWAGVGNAARVTVTSNGDTGVPIVEILNADRTVARGEMLWVRVNEAEHATNLYMDFRHMDNDWEWYGGRGFENVEIPFECGLATADLEAGQRYRLSVGANGVGYNASGTDIEDESLFFTVVEPEKAITFSLSKTEGVSAGEDIVFSVYAPGALALRLTVDEVGGEEEWNYDNRGYDGDHVQDGFALWFNGTYRLRAEARFGEDDVWTRAEDEYIIVIDSQPFPGDAVIEVDRALVMEGEEIAFRIRQAQDVGWYKLNVENCTDGYMLADCDFDQAGAYTLEDGMLFPDDHIQSGKVYSLWVSLWKRGYTPTESERVFVAVVDPGRILTLPAGLTEIDEEAFANIAAQMVVLPDGVTDIQHRAFADCPNLVALIEPSGATEHGDITEGCPSPVIRASSY